MKLLRRKFLHLAAGAPALPWALIEPAAAQSAPTGIREVPPRSIPVPDTVSPQMQAIIARPFNPNFNLTPETLTDWKKRVDDAARNVVAGLPKIRETLGVTVEPTTITGVRAFVVTPKSIPPSNSERVLLHLHGGVRVFNPGEAGTREAILMAGFAGFKVISVDYRMPPDHPFPAALDDAVSAYRELLKTTSPENIGIFGTSAGGSLTLTTLLRAKMEGLPMPGAIAPGTPTVDLTKTGDSLFTNAFVDNVLGTQDGLHPRNGLALCQWARPKRPIAVTHLWGGDGVSAHDFNQRDLETSICLIPCGCIGRCERPASKPCCKYGKVNPTHSTMPIRPRRRLRNTTTKLRASLACT